MNRHILISKFSKNLGNAFTKFFLKILEITSCIDIDIHTGLPRKYYGREAISMTL